MTDLRALLLATVFLIAPLPALAAGSSFQTDAGDRISATVMEVAQPDDVHSKPVSAANPMPITAAPSAAGTSGGLPVNTDGTAASYAAVATFTPVVGIVGEICGSSTKTIVVRALKVEGWAGTAGGMTLLVHRLSSADTGGTPVAANKPPMVSASAAATALVQGYSAAAASGTSLGSIVSGTVNFPVLGSSVPRSAIPEGPGTQPITLVGAAQCIDLTLGGTAPTTPTLALSFLWAEF